MKKTFAIVGLAIAAFAAPAVAKTVTYQCEIDQNRSNRGWLPSVLFIGHNEKTDEVIVSDPIILYNNDRQPMQGKLVKNNDKRMTVSWVVVTKSRSNQRAKMNYRATYVKSEGKLQLNATPLGYANNFHASGTCKVKVAK
ncbi:hypothetical protein [Thalassococcus lentus]|uniref:Uncharacterized protein n=1 Tax=Thalassococcus lentus TaxID=1210524 RepID=A0ABT4XS55_9RHOB|nr:hypothetical protein [Thalassococcus lentus]MDA7424767.1 hypothetical protein [Thalassococcus lentus]